MQYDNTFKDLINNPFHSPQRILGTQYLQSNGVYVFTVESEYEQIPILNPNN